MFFSIVRVTYMTHHMAFIGAKRTMSCKTFSLSESSVHIQLGALLTVLTLQLT